METVKVHFEIIKREQDIDNLCESINKFKLDNNSIIKKKLNEILVYNILSNNNSHKDNILKCKTIKDAHIYCKINNLSSQCSGILIEEFIKNKYNMKKNKSSLCIGDLKYNNTNIEIKISNGGKKNNKFNYVQLRVNHICDYILTAYYISKENLDSLGELFIFKLKKEDIKTLILKYGHYAHGTIMNNGSITQDNLNDNKNKNEYAIRPKYGDKCWNELLKFRIDENRITV